MEERTAAEIEQEVVDELTISDDLDEEFMKQAAYFAHWAFQHARGEDAVRKLEEFVDLQFAELYSAHKHKHPDSKENESKSFVKKHKRYKTALQDLNRAKLSRDILKAAVRAFEIRRDMLIQLGANQRHEFEGTPSIRKQAERANVTVKNSLKKKKRRTTAAKAAGARAVLKSKKKRREQHG